MNKSTKSGATYRDAGVNLEAAEVAVEEYRTITDRTSTPGVLHGVGGFAGLFSLKDAGVDIEDPVLVSGTDGVGTKLKLAFELNRHDTIGIDCVAMCVNDIATTGARPLFFLDYLAVGELSPSQAAEIVGGIATACSECHCALVGGETAEMPGFFPPGEYDVAGFCVGVVERAEILGSHRVRKGDAIIGVGSSGFHSNGYSLIRKVLEDQQLDLRTCYEGTSSESQKSLGDLLLEPTRLYVKAIESVRPMGLHASAHITGGGLFENLPRVLPEGFGARVNPRAWNRLPLFDWICERGGIAHDEAYRVFNMGIGMALIVESEHAKGAVAALVADGYESWIIGHVQEGEGVVIEGS